MNEKAAETFDSEAGYRAAIEATLALAQQDVRIFDRDLVRMAFEAPARIAMLEAFLVGARHRRLYIALHETEALEHRSPRMIALMRRFSHAIEVRHTPTHLQHLTDCLVLADELHATIRIHSDHARGKRLVSDGQAVQTYWQRFTELWEASQPGSPATATGL